jgi:3-deoxy-D-arabino-heptulosonate 7-phosphate (DAHP) synthase class II
VQLCGGNGKHRDVAERHSWNWEFVRDWLATRLVADAARFIERNLEFLNAAG